MTDIISVAGAQTKALMKQSGAHALKLPLAEAEGELG